MSKHLELLLISITRKDICKRANVCASVKATLHFIHWMHSHNTQARLKSGWIICQSIYRTARDWSWGKKKNFEEKPQGHSKDPKKPLGPHFPSPRSFLEICEINIICQLVLENNIVLKFHRTVVIGSNVANALFLIFNTVNIYKYNLYTNESSFGFTFSVGGSCAYGLLSGLEENALCIYRSVFFPLWNSTRKDLFKNLLVAHLGNDSSQIQTLAHEGNL